ncbi:adenylyl-sulfate kinase [Nanoarchaeota archaeon]
MIKEGVAEITDKNSELYKFVQDITDNYPSYNKKGSTIFFTGLSGAGKSTLCERLQEELEKTEKRKIISLDGDVVRQKISKDLNFSKEHRDINIKRIGYIAKKITKKGGIVICAQIAPYDLARNYVREDITKQGNFALVHVSTPLEECERRDAKGLYKKARAGIIKDFTGIGAPYETPRNAEISIDTTNKPPKECINKILYYLKKEKHL